MTSMRIDSKASAKLWAKRLGKLVELIREDGGEVYLNLDANDIAVGKDGSFFTIFGVDVSDDY